MRRASELEHGPHLRAAAITGHVTTVRYKYFIVLDIFTFVILASALPHMSKLYPFLVFSIPLVHENTFTSLDFFCEISGLEKCSYDDLEFLPCLITVI
jgi:hypothetical protein